MPCKGPCSKQETEVRNMRFDSAVPDPGNGDDCPDEPPRDIVRQAAGEVKNELEGVEDLQRCEGGDECGCSGSWSDWGDWLDGERSKPVTVGACKYTLKFTFQTRGRLYQGVCVTVGGTSAAMGIIPGAGAIVTVAKGVDLRSDVVLRIGELLKKR